MAELRALSTRATITPTSFTNVYNWGDFKGDPAVLMERYFDAFLYLANWGTRQLMLRLPRQILDADTAGPYLRGEGARAWTSGDHLILELGSGDEEPEFDEGGEGRLSSLIPLRAELADGDLRCLYLGWLLCAQSGELDDDAVEPPVPPELATPSASLEALADFLRIDHDLVAVAAQRSPAAAITRPVAGELVRWISELPESEKVDLLRRFIEGPELRLRAETVRRFRRATATEHPRPGDADDGRRTVAELLAAAEQRAETRRRAEAEQQAQQRARRKQEQAAARATYLDTLAGREDDLWTQIDGLIGTKRPADYDRAVELLKDLRDLHARSEQTDHFHARLNELRTRHARKPSLIERLDRARLGAPPAVPSRNVR